MMAYKVKGKSFSLNYDFQYITISPSVENRENELDSQVFPSLGPELNKTKTRGPEGPEALT